MRANPRSVKLHRSYSVSELAACLRVHKNTVRHWQGAGLEPIDGGRPVLFQGVVVRAFLAKRRASRKRPCPHGTLYCLRCREPRPPALGMVEYVSFTAVTGNLQALCGACEAMTFRRARKANLAQIMPGLEIQFAQAQPRLNGCARPSQNSDSERQAP